MASPLPAFNRFELTYLVSPAQAAEIRDEPAELKDEAGRPSPTPVEPRQRPLSLTALDAPTTTGAK
ncbi:hypothetical protein [Kitasatospora sp. DSM 101779]|uniref:hypothetical protein n=1 Tax=Kitasatospora sp. DSM 101779 TaxID=2853165 RepID=UPI003987C921